MDGDPTTEEEYYRWCADTYGHRWTVTAVPLLTGQWFHSSRCNEKHCRGREVSLTGVVDHRADLEEPSSYTKPCKARDIVINYGNDGSKVATRARKRGDVIPVRRPQAQISLDEYWLPDTVAVDASCNHTTGEVAWAAVTGAGWVFFGRQEDTSTTRAEMVALIEALSRIPYDGVDVQVFSDHWEVVHTALRALDKRPMPKVKWLSPSRYDLLQSVLWQHRTQGSVTVRRKPRNSNELMMRADQVARAVRKGGNIPKREPWLIWRLEDPYAPNVQAVHRVVPPLPLDPGSFTGMADTPGDKDLPMSADTMEDLADYYGTHCSVTGERIAEGQDPSPR